MRPSPPRRSRELGSLARRLVPAFLLVATTLGLASCRSQPWRQVRMIHNEAGIAVYLERKFDENDQPVDAGLAHPVEIDGDAMAALLASLRFFEDRRFFPDRDRQVFNERQIESLGVVLSRALADLGTDERLRFLTTQQEAFLVFQSLVATSGVIFSRQEGAIDIAFDMIEEEPELDMGDPRTARFYRQPTEIVDARMRILTPLDVAHVRSSDGKVVHPLWIRATREQIDRLLAIARRGRDPAATATAPGSQPAATRPQPEPERAESTVPSTRQAPAEDRGAVEKVLTYRGCDVYRADQVYYALPPDAGELDLKKVEAREYQLLFSGDSLRQVTAHIDRAREAGLLD